ncbi:MAG: helix-turn-helix domain-containing protein [Chloroflexota bacterium]
MAESFGKTIRELRKACGISQRDLAERSGIDFTYLSKIENERMPPPAEPTIQVMAETLGADADELIRLAGKVPSDLAEFLVKDPHVIRFLRSVQGDISTRQDWIEFIRKTEQHENEAG